MKGIREIAITDMPEVSIGNVQSDEAKTGVTVLLRLQRITRSTRSFYPADPPMDWQQQTV